MGLDIGNKKLTVFTLAMINIIAIDSLRNLPLNAQYGYAIVGFYLLAALCFLLPCTLVTAELATHYPETGGSYVWVRQAFGARWSFANIWLQWIYNVVWYPTILSFIAATVAYLFNPELANHKPYIVSVVIATFIVATLINCFGIKTSSRISIIGALIGTLIPMAFISALGISWVMGDHISTLTFSWQQLLPNLQHPQNLSLMAGLLFSVMGIEMSAIHAGDVKNPQKDYPRALWISTTVIVLSLVLSSLAIAVVVPHNTISLLNGLNQALQLFLSAYHLQWLLPIAIICIVIGGFCGMAAWVLGPARAISIATDDGCLPKLLGKRNRHGAPVGILVAQAVVVLLLCLLFLEFKSINTSYWILSDLTAQLALLYYAMLFLAAIRLRYITPKKPDCFRIPGGKFGIWFVGLLGFFSCIAAMVVGFLPPVSAQIPNVTQYQWMLGIGIVIFTVPPFLISARETK